MKTPTILFLLISSLAIAGCDDSAGREEGGGDRGTEGEGEGEDGRPGEGEGEGASEGEGEPRNCPEPEQNSPWRPFGLSGEVVTGFSLEATEPQRLWAATRRGGLRMVELSDDPSFVRVPTPHDDLADVQVQDGLIRILTEDDGVFESADEGASWHELNDGYELMDLPFAVGPDLPVGKALELIGGDLYLVATAGGVFRLRDGGTGWDNLTAGSGLVNPAVEVLHGDAEGTLWLGLADLGSFVPSALSELVRSVVLRSTDEGATWEPFDEGIDSRHVTSFAEDQGVLYAGTNGGGVYFLEPGGSRWEALEDLPDPNVLGVWSVPAGGLVIGSADSFLMLSHDKGACTREVTGPLNAFMPVVAAAFVGEGGSDMIVGTAGDGARRNAEVLAGPHADRGDPPTIQDGKVHLALSFHVNLNHSYRGDTPDEDGFGKDIRVIRGILDMLDRHPEVRADWDFDNAVSLDHLLPAHAPDIIQRILPRLDGRDSVRVMSWNNGLVVAETADEIIESVKRAQDSYTLAFGAAQAPGIQPQENMFSADHVDLYQSERLDNPIQWITLSYSASNFSGFRNDALLSPEQRYNLLRLQANNDEGAAMLLLPVYHHADVVDHGGLVSWVKQIHREIPQRDAVLAIHFDADSETWLSFEREIEALEAADLSFFRYTTLQDYFYRHRARPTGDVVISRDLAAGPRDGLEAWSEKWINREVFTPIERARIMAFGADQLRRRQFMEVADRQPVEDRLAEAFTERLLALSTTHFGLANPALHPEREAAALAQAASAESTATAALAAAVGRIKDEARPPGDVWLFHPGDDEWSGVAKINVEFSEGEHDPDTLTARIHRLGGEADGRRAPSELASHTEHGDGSVATGELWVTVGLDGQELVGVSFESPDRAPRWGDDVAASRQGLSNGLVQLSFNESGQPVQLLVEHKRGETVPLGNDTEWWQPWITWQGRRYSPRNWDIERTNRGGRGYMAEVQLTGDVDLPGGGIWEITYTFRVVKDQRLLYIDVDTTYPGGGDDGGPDPRMTEVVPLGLYPWIQDWELIDHDNDEDTPMRPNRPWLERHVVWREGFRGKVGGFPVQDVRKALNSAAAMGWGAVFTTLIAFDRWERSSPAFMPIRVQLGQAVEGRGKDTRVLLAPFGTLDGDSPDPRPERTAGSGLGARLTRLAPHFGPFGPSMAGKSEHFSVAVGGVPATIGGSVSARPDNTTIEAARSFATRPLVIKP